MSKMIVTTSWDDGHALDIKLAKLLDKYGFKGTFYLPQNAPDFPAEEALTERQIKSLSRKHEIGAHALNHCDLTACSPARLQKEILGSKIFLEKLLRKKLSMFAYPYGRYSDRVLSSVKESGFLGARTVKVGFSKNPFELNVSVAAGPMPLVRLKKIILSQPKKTCLLFLRNLMATFKSIGFILRHGFPLRAIIDWQAFALNSFELARKKGGIWHLWGHSWEIGVYDGWEELESVLKEVAWQSDILPVTNSDAIALIGTAKT